MGDDYIVNGHKIWCSFAHVGEFSEVFFSDVRVPIANRVGAENDGWRVTNVMLRFERRTAFASEMINPRSRA